MKKQFFSLLALVSIMLVGGVSSAWAEDVTQQYHKPAPAPGTDYEVVYTTVDNMKSFYTAGWAKDGNGGDGWGTSSSKPIKDWINPKTDTAGEGTSPEGIVFKSSGAKLIYIYVTGCSKIKAYMGGFASGSTNKLAQIVATPSDNSTPVTATATTSMAQNYYGDLTIDGLDKTKSYEVKIMNTQSSDCTLYALRLYGDMVSADVTTHTITSSINIDGAGVVAMNPTTGVVVDKNKIELTATANAGYKFVNWTDASDKEISTENPYTFTPTEDATVKANFAKLITVTFAMGSAENGIAPDAIYGDAGEEITIPTNQFIYSEGKTLTAWTDGQNNYNVGSKLPLGSSDLTLTPVFETNTATLAETEQAVPVTWNFVRNEGAPVFSYENGTNWNDITGNAYYVAQATVNGKSVDVGIQFETRSSKTGLSGNGKINNETRKNGAQINVNTVFTVPVTNGCVIEMETEGPDYTISTTTFDGTTDYEGGSKIAYTYTGDKSNIDIVIKDGSYFKYIKITYPAAFKPYELNFEDTDLYSLYLDYDATIPANVTAYTGSLSQDETTLTLNEITGGVIPANTAVVVKTTTPDEYTFEEATSTDNVEAITGNSLLGVLVDTPVSTLETSSGKTVLTLGLLEGKTGFRKPAGTSILANRIYLPVTTTKNGAKGVSISFGGDTTGISEISASKAEADAPVYNLAGQRVAAGAKGLLIKNGKKYISK